MAPQRQNIDTGTSDLLAWQQGKVLVLCMNRPKARNALSLAMLEAMEHYLAIAEAEPDIGCVVLTGAKGAFCAGGDVKAMAVTGKDQSSTARVQYQARLQRGTAGKLFSMPKPTIAAIDGAAAGAGFSLAMACDLRTMTNDSFLTTAFVKVGLSGDFGGTYFLSQLIGSAKARELYFLSDRVYVEEALRLGLTNRVFSSESFLDETLALAEGLSNAPSSALGFMKQNLNRALDASVIECLDVEAALHIACTATADHREAVAAFVERRPPTYAKGE